MLVYREDMKAVGLNPDCNIENEIQQEGKMGDQRYSRTTNPYLNVEMTIIIGYKVVKVVLITMNLGKTNTYYISLVLVVVVLVQYLAQTRVCQVWMMIGAKQDVVTKHTQWIQTVVARVNRFREVIKSMTKFSQVENFASHEQIQWKIDPEILADKFGMDLVISIDDAAESIMNIGKPKPTREEKILAWKKAQGISLAS